MVQIGELFLYSVNLLLFAVPEFCDDNSTQTLFLNMSFLNLSTSLTLHYLHTVSLNIGFFLTSPF